MPIPDKLNFATLMAGKRLKAEIQHFNKRSLPGVVSSVGPVTTDNLFKWIADLNGPLESPYEHGIFQLCIEYPPDYPFKPPEVTFMTRIFHPNISHSGYMCLDVLQKDWSPSSTTMTILSSVSSLLENPTPVDALCSEAAALLRDNPTKYKEIAREWTDNYAKNYTSKYF